MYLFLVILILLICLLLALVVLAQNPKGGGLSSQFGAGGAANLMGVKRTGDLLEKLTWGFAIGLIILSLATHVIGGSSAGPARNHHGAALDADPLCGARASAELCGSRSRHQQLPVADRGADLWWL